MIAALSCGPTVDEKTWTDAGTSVRMKENEDSAGHAVLNARKDSLREVKKTYDDSLEWAKKEKRHFDSVEASKGRRR
jgi:hypothetical protein